MCMPCRYHTLFCSRSQVLTARVKSSSVNKICFSRFGSRHSLRPAASDASVDRSTPINILEAFVDVSH
jgi:hypothetical protein